MAARERRCASECERADLLAMPGVVAELIFALSTQVILVVVMLVPLVRKMREVRVMLRVSGLARNGDRPRAKNEPRHPLLEGQHQADRQHAARNEQRQQHDGQHEMARYHSDPDPSKRWRRL